jgi:hypothetical protein
LRDGAPRGGRFVLVARPRCGTGAASCSDPSPPPREGAPCSCWLGARASPTSAQAINRGLAAIVAGRPEPATSSTSRRTTPSSCSRRRPAPRAAGKWLNRYRYELGELIEIAKAITTEREIDKLLGVILEKSRFITGADAGSIYVVEGDDPDPLAPHPALQALAERLGATSTRASSPMPISPRSHGGLRALAPRAARIDDVYDLPPGSPYGFDRSFDAKIGYRTKSMLCAPLLSRTGEVIGVIQLINKKRDPRRSCSRPTTSTIRWSPSTSAAKSCS